MQVCGNFYCAADSATIFESARIMLEIPADLVVRGIYHTHPAGNDGAASVFFSPKDVDVARRLKVTSYIGVYYDRSIRYFDPSTMTSSTIRSGRFTVHHGAKGGLLCKQCFN